MIGGHAVVTAVHAAGAGGHHTVRARVDGAGTGKLTVDSAEVSQAVAGFTLWVQPGSRPNLTVRLHAAQLIHVDGAQVTLDADSIELLGLLGWTAPQGDE